VCGKRGLNTARLSRFARSYWTIDDSRSEAGLLAGLRRLGEQAARHILLPASDDTAWLFAKHSDELGRWFTMYAPRLEVIEATLDKQRLREACSAAGVATLPSWFPENLASVTELASQLDFPVLIKPRLHVFRTRREKGMVVHSPQDLEGAFSTFVRRERGREGERDTTAQPLPLVQTFVQGAVENVLSITGFMDRSGTRSIVSATRKILQRSRPVGVGLAFEGIAPPEKVAEDALKLCRHLGVFGVFEIEFVWHDNAWRVIDFNPRFYQEMCLDVARGIPLPLLAYLDACGDLDGLDAALSAARAHAKPPLCFSDMFTTTLMLALRAIVNPSAARDSIVWHWRRRRDLVDATFDLQDPLPLLGHACCELRLGFEQLPRLFKEARLPSTAEPARWQYERTG
jgi:predicted ATP-grasp superfamily ATP-dependent carboligase